MAATALHCFEEAGLGRAPFRYVGLEEQVLAHGQRVLGQVGGCEITTKPGSTCDYCGTYIVNIFVVEGADGNRFKVGCECIRKTGDAGLVLRVNEDVRKMERNKRAAAKAARATADRELCQAAPLGKLAGKPHPTPDRAARGETLADWARWMRDNGYHKALAVVLRRELA